MNPYQFAECIQPDVDPEWWFNEDKDSAETAMAVALCHLCPLQYQCRRDYASIPHGVVAGVHPDDRQDEVVEMKGVRYVDLVAVEKVCSGEPGHLLTTAEKRVAIPRMHEAGYGKAEIAKIVNVSGAHLNRYLAGEVTGDRLGRVKQPRKRAA